MYKYIYFFPLNASVDDIEFTLRAVNLSNFKQYIYTLDKCQTTESSHYTIIHMAITRLLPHVQNP